MPKGGAPCHTNPNVPVPTPAAVGLLNASNTVPNIKRLSKQYNQYERDPASNKRYGRAWKRIRDRYIKAHPLCEECQKQGKLTPAEEVHHILPLSKGGGNEKSNLMALCKSCHSRITAESGDRW